ncbi:PCC domain-containing protein, partial [Chloroflexota bacterium]
KPMLHLHGALGRGESVTAGCLRPGVDTWLVAEAVITEITGVKAARQPDGPSGFELLEVGE